MKSACIFIGWLFRRSLCRSNAVNKDIVATREYFPRRIGSAIRQRTRWVTGIGLQCWERVGWTGSVAMRYWLWRDRKGLVTNPLSCLTNLLFLVGLVDWLRSVEVHRAWVFAVKNHDVLVLCSLRSEERRVGKECRTRWSA